MSWVYYHSEMKAIVNVQAQCMRLRKLSVCANAVNGMFPKATSEFAITFRHCSYRFQTKNSPYIPSVNTFEANENIITVYARHNIELEIPQLLRTLLA